MSNDVQQQLRALNPSMSSIAISRLLVSFVLLLFFAAMSASLGKMTKERKNCGRAFVRRVARTFVAQFWFDVGSNVGQCLDDFQMNCVLVFVNRIVEKRLKLKPNFFQKLNTLIN